MKFLTLTLALSLGSTIANAQTIQIADVPSDFDSTYSATLNMNESLNRIWVEITSTPNEPMGDDDAEVNTYREMVPGLTLDRANNQALLATDQGSLPIAVIKHQWGLFGGFDYFKLDPNASFQFNTVQVQQDDGFEINTSTVMRVTLQIAD